jgi:hypothetical protein
MKIDMTNRFITKSKIKHNNKYDYSKVKYINAHTKVCIICPKHGEFWCTPNSHLNGTGCPSCASNKKMTTEEFVAHAKELHGDKYDYSKVKYINANTKVCIICPKHGEFWCKPSAHLQNRSCPICQESRLEKEIKDFLNKENILYFYRYRPQWLKKLELDFYLPNFKIGIECQGLQHFEPVKHFGGEEKFFKQLKNDLEKKQLCEENNVKLLFFSHLKKENIITKIETLKKEIYENKTID